LPILWLVEHVNKEMVMLHSGLSKKVEVVVDDVWSAADDDQSQPLRISDIPGL
jgi:hypothetical protein